MLLTFEDPLFEHFSSFFANHDCVNLLSASRTLSSKWLKKSKIIVLRSQDAFQFFLDAKFRKMIFSKIVDPRKQLDIIIDNCSVEKYEEIKKRSFRGFRCPGIHRWLCGTSFFETIMSKASSGNFEIIDKLELSGTYQLFESTHYLSRVQTSLQLYSVLPPTSNMDFLSPTLQDLGLFGCTEDPRALTSFNASIDFPKTVVLPSLPQLRRLAISNTRVENIADYYFVKNLELENLSLPNISDWFSLVPKLSIKTCTKVSDLSLLQKNREVTLVWCPAVKDLSACFKNTFILTVDMCSDRYLSFDASESDISIDDDPPNSIHIDLSYYQQCRRFSLALDPEVTLYMGRLSSQEIVSPFLTSVSLKGLNDQVSLEIFRNVKILELVNARVDLDLEGLEKVPTVILRYMKVLTSLAGLGQNQKVIVEKCPTITDFSSLRNVVNVELIGCEGFYDVSHVDHVQHLKISNCSNLKDASWLGKIPYDPVTEAYPIQSLSIVSCRKLRSIQGLAEVIPSFSYEDCPYFLFHNRVVLKLSNSSSMQAASGILSLPDSLYGIIFEYVKYEDVVQFLSTTPYLYDTLMKKYRIITLEYDDHCTDFFTDNDFMKEVLGKIEQPSKQLEIIEVYDLSVQNAAFRIETAFQELPSLRRLRIPPQSFLFLCEHRGKHQQEDWFVGELIINYLNDDESKFDGMQLIPYLYKARESLSLDQVSFPVNALESRHFAPTLKELSLTFCSNYDNDDDDSDDEIDHSIINPDPIILPVLPQLKKLLVEHSFVSNLKDFHYLQELELTYLPNVESVEAFSSIPRLKLIDLKNLSEIKYLQQNTEVEIDRCGITDFTHCFPKVKRLTIRLSDDLDEETMIQLDLSHYPELQEFTLSGGGDESFPTGKLAQQLCSQDHLPASLKKVTLNGLHEFCNTCIYHSVESLSFVGCPAIVSVDGLGSVRVLKLSSLWNLTSLQGLLPKSTNKKKRKSSSSSGNDSNDSKQGNLFEVTIEQCAEIEDFSPLRTVPKVTIINCKGFRNGWSERLDHSEMFRTN